MSQEDRRAAIIAATVPLLLADETDLSTARIAKAAGIAEGTVFRAFKDKKELVLASVKAALVADPEVERIRQIDGALPLQSRLAAAVEVLGEYLERIWRVIRAMQASGVQGTHQTRRGAGAKADGPFQIHRLAAELVALIESGPESLRTGDDTAARLLLGLVFSNRRNDMQLGGDTAMTSAELVDLFLNGVLETGAAQQQSKPDQKRGKR